ncbi:hypothetical protein [Pseudomonas viridiflava]|uniref:hypothetical protein n=1 Tax=Pseudomonas viridiflava TaxID=33069 RepID=UPI001C319C24|nr:hypothetical protein [Pseudomonas viridiflava]QXG42221.1 hypothetical protein KTT55_06910 [Pseudomonas viridiflava]
MSAAPQPPALGGEPDTLAVVTLGCFSSEELGDIDIEPQMSVLERIQQERVRSDSDEHLDLIDRAHFDKSQLEIERLQSEAEENHKEREVICSNYDQLKARCDELEGLLSKATEQETGTVVQRDKFKALLRDLVRDSLASDFNEHWDSYQDAKDALSTPAGSAPLADDIPDFSPGNGNKARRRAEALQEAKANTDYDGFDNGVD